jgi:hypothetical protein
VALHRVPVGLIIWWLLLPRHGPVAAAGGVGSVILVTWAGYLVGTGMAGAAHGAPVELYQAFVSGSLVHVVFHQGRHDHDHDHNHRRHDHRHGHAPEGGGRDGSAAAPRAHGDPSDGPPRHAQ